MTIAIRAALLIPGKGESIDDGLVVVEGATITFAGAATKGPSTSVATVSEVPVLMPGLWDCHAHLFGASFRDLERRSG